MRAFTQAIVRDRAIDRRTTLLAEDALLDEAFLDGATFGWNRPWAKSFSNSSTTLSLPCRFFSPRTRRPLPIEARSSVTTRAGAGAARRPRPPQGRRLHDDGRTPIIEARLAPGASTCSKTARTRPTSAGDRPCGSASAAYAPSMASSRSRRVGLVLEGEEHGRSTDRGDLAQHLESERRLAPAPVTRR